MTKRYKAFGLTLSALTVFLLGCAQKTQEDIPKIISEASLLMDAHQVSAGQSISGHIVIDLHEEWHTYSDPPGDSGMAPIANFQGPDGWKFELGDLPPHSEHRDGSGITYVYFDQLKIPFTVSIPSNATATAAVFNVDLQYLVCREICVPQSAQLSQEVIVKP